MLRQRATLRDLRLGNVGTEADSELEAEPTEAIRPFERSGFYRELNEVVESVDLETQTLSLFRIYFDYVGTSGLVSAANRDAERIGDDLRDRALTHDTEATLLANYAERTLTGFFVTDNSESRQSETIVGAFLKDFLNPIQLDDQWLMLETQAACVILNELNEQNTRSLVDALELTLNSTTPATSFLVYKPYLKKRQAREVLMQELLTERIQDENVSLEFQEINSTATGATVGIEIISSFDEDPEDESQFSNVDLQAAAQRSASEFELGVCTRRLGVAEYQDELKPGNNPRLKLWFNISASQIANPELIQTLKELNVPATNIGLEITDHEILESGVAQKKLQEIKAQGFSLALDDLTTTSPRLSMIARLPFNTLKLNIEKTSASNSLDLGAQISYLSSLVEGLGVQITVVGVATSTQAQEAKRLGATNIQGTYLDDAGESIELG